MIYDTLTESAPYFAVHPRLRVAFDYLHSFDQSTPDGRYDLEPDNNTYVLVQSYATQPASEKSFESHRDYIDVQYLARGEEVMLSAPVIRLKPTTDYDATKDFRLYADPAHFSAHYFAPGDFAVYFPPDGHKPGCSLNGSAPVKKVVIKIRL